jgi:25S rRNA (uracil2634-N3)-methyltransferase
MAKKRKLGSGTGAPKPTKHINASGSVKKPAGPRAKPHKQKQNSSSSAAPEQQHHTEPTIPFSPEDKILLVGDGDLSFAASLVEHHYCADVTATVFEKSREELLEKYPQAAGSIAKIEAEDGCRVLFGVDVTKMAPFANKPGRSKALVVSATAYDEPASPEEDAESQRLRDEKSEFNKRAITGANKIALGHRPNKPHSSTTTGVMDRIIFNFPHVGGKSTDVNRQVRYNQELLVSFFRRAIPSLAPGGSVIVTLFEGEPYTLWNIRDLARHSSLQVERSFRFQASAYPGYHHARTLGVVRSRSGETGGGWKGENRTARSYVFVKKDDNKSESSPKLGLSAAQRGTKRSRKYDDYSSDEE